MQVMTVFRESNPETNEYCMCFQKLQEFEKAVKRLTVSFHCEVLSHLRSQGDY